MPELDARVTFFDPHPIRPTETRSDPPQMQCVTLTVVEQLSALTTIRNSDIQCFNTNTTQCSDIDRYTPRVCESSHRLLDITIHTIPSRSLSEGLPKYPLCCPATGRLSAAQLGVLVLATRAVLI